MEGRKDDSTKNRLDLIPYDVVWAIGEILTFGAAKYADRNWEKGMRWGRCFAALMRHLFAWWQSQSPTTTSFLFGELDMETQKSHLHHAGACLFFLIGYELRGIGEDDRPRPSKS